MRKRAISCCGVILCLQFCLLLGGCKQSQGDRCQLPSDCASDLICCVAENAAARAIGGVCTLPTKCELQGDSGPPADRGVKEAGKDILSRDGKADIGKPAPDRAALDKTTPDQAKPDSKAPTPDVKTEL